MSEDIMNSFKFEDGILVLSEEQESFCREMAIAKLIIHHEMEFEKLLVLEKSGFFERLRNDLKKEGGDEN